MTTAVAAAPSRSLSAGTIAAVGIAAAAMVATLPGRTHGLGLITEPLSAHLDLGRVPFAAINFWATLIGAAFCLPVGWLLDRLGVRVVLSAVLIAFGATVLAIPGVSPGVRTFSLPVPDVFFSGGLEWSAVPLDLFLLILLTRGLGQAALSVVSLTMVGKASGDRPGLVIGVYSFLVSIGFMAAYGAVKGAFESSHLDWREVWGGMGWVLIVFGGLALFFVPRTRAKVPTNSEAAAGPSWGITLRAALRSLAFWVFGMATSFYGMVAAGTSLFNQSILAERGFDREVFLTILTWAPLVGLGANLAAGYLATRVGLGKILAVALVVQAAALAAFPMVTTLIEVYAYGAAMALTGGVVTVVFFSVWRQAYGPLHLGKIQGAAQLLTVFASAAGPLVLAAGNRAYGSYGPLMQNLALVALGFALLAAIVPLPRAEKPQAEDAS